MAVKILEAVAIAAEKKIVLKMESDAYLSPADIEKLRGEWSKKLNCKNIEIQVKYAVAAPENPAEPPLPEPPMPEPPMSEPPMHEPPAPEDKPDAVHVSFSKEAYLVAQQKRSSSTSSQSGYSGAKAKKGYTNKGNGKFNKKKALTPAEGEEPRKDRNGNVIVLGNAIDQETTKMEDVTYDSGFVAVEGKIFDFDTRELKSGSYSVTFAMTDNTYSVKIQFYVEAFDLAFAKSYLTPGKGKTKDEMGNIYARVYGQPVIDKYTSELIMRANSIVMTKNKVRRDLCEEKRVELHLHTKMSAQDAITDPNALISLLGSWGHKAVAITDHGCVQAYPDMFKAMSAYSKSKDIPKEDRIKLIYGCECYLSDDELIDHDSDDILSNVLTKDQLKNSHAWHCILLVKNIAGLKNLYKLISYSNLKYYYKRPRIPRKELMLYREGLIVGSACSEGELFEAVLNGNSDEELLKMASFYDYLEIQPTGNDMYLLRNNRVSSVEDIENINKKIIWLGDKLGKLTVATGDVHFLNPDDSIYRAVLQGGQGYSDCDMQPPLYLKSTDEMLSDFKYLGDRAYEVVVKNTNLIADMIDVIRPVPDGFFPPVIEGSDDKLRQSCFEKAKRIYGDPLPDIVQKRLERELNAIISNGYSIMYITAKELVAESARNGYQVGSRGSVGSSLAAYMADITEVNSLCAHYRCGNPDCLYSEFHDDPIYSCGFDMEPKTCPNCGRELIRDGYNIPFETFLGFNGDKVPDIDLNFASDDQPNAHKFTEVLFGKGYVFRAGTIAELGEKPARGYVLKYMEAKGKKVSETEIKRLSQGFSQVRKTTGQHPGGIMVIPRDKEIYDFTPVQHPAEKVEKDTITTHFDYNFLHDNILKLDILGHDGPQMLRLMEEYTGISSLDVDINDAKVLSLFNSAEALNLDPKIIEKLGADYELLQLGTAGIPEMGTGFVQNMMLKARPATISDLVRISGVSHGTDVWAGNAESLIDEGICQLSECICCRDDIMLYLIGRGLEKKMSFDIMEAVRKGKGLKPEWEEAMHANNVPEWYINSCKKIKYMFPKAHAVAYVVCSLRIAWYKVYEPKAYYATRFSVKLDDFDSEYMIHGIDKAFMKLTPPDKRHLLDGKDKAQAPLYELIVEMNARNINFLPVDIYKSDARYFKPEGDGIRPPLAVLSGVGLSQTEPIAAERDRRLAKGEEFISIEDFQLSTGVNKGTIEALRAEGCFEGLPETNSISIFDWM